MMNPSHRHVAQFLRVLSQYTLDVRRYHKGHTRNSDKGQFAVTLLVGFI